jgi:glycosyltransferase involved in cell wall biosynthesis
MAMGKAIIAPDLRPLREIIKDSENGVLIRPKDQKDMKEKITSLALNKQLREKLGNNAIEYVLSNHTWDINSQKILSIIRNLL